MKVISYEAVSLLFKYLPISKQNPSDIAARQKLQIAAWMSLWPTTLSKTVFVLTPNSYHFSVDEYLQHPWLIARLEQTGGGNLRCPSRYLFRKNMFATDADYTQLRNTVYHTPPSGGYPNEVCDTGRQGSPRSGVEFLRQAKDKFG